MNCKKCEGTGEEPDVPHDELNKPLCSSCGGTGLEKQAAKIVVCINGGVLVSVYVSPALLEAFKLETVLHDEDNLKADGVTENDRLSQFEETVKDLEAVE